MILSLSLLSSSLSFEDFALTFFVDSIAKSTVKFIANSSIFASLENSLDIRSTSIENSIRAIFITSIKKKNKKKNKKIKEEREKENNNKKENKNVIIRRN